MSNFKKNIIYFYFSSASVLRMFQADEENQILAASIKRWLAGMN